MKINLTTTTPEPAKDDSLSFEQLRDSALDGVYLCRTHQHARPSQRIVRQAGELVIFDNNSLCVVAEDLLADSCRFILAPEQVVNITFEKQVEEDQHIPRGRLVPGATGKVIAGFRVPANEKQYLALQSQSGITAGDKVRVIRAAETYEGGWGNSWTDEMDKCVGKVFTVNEVCSSGVALPAAPGLYLRFPFFVLEKVS